MCGQNKSKIINECSSLIFDQQRNSSGNIGIQPLLVTLFLLFINVVVIATTTTTISITTTTFIITTIIFNVVITDIVVLKFAYFLTIAPKARYKRQASDAVVSMFCEEYPTLQCNTIQLDCPRGEIRLAANKNITNIKTSHHCILYIVTKKTPPKTLKQTRKLPRTVWVLCPLLK